MFCVECGADCDNTFDGMCFDCYKSKRTLVAIPPTIDLTFCSICGAVKGKKGWNYDADIEEEIRNQIAKKIKYSDIVDTIQTQVEVIKGADSGISSRVKVNLGGEGQRETVESSVQINLKKLQCPQCNRMMGEYYEATIQVRTWMDDLPHNIPEFISNISLGGKEFIASMEPVKGGLDIKISSQSTAKDIGKKMEGSYGGTLNASYTLQGKKEGKRIWRMTLLVRLPGLKEGDILRLNNKLYLISHIKGDVISSYDLKGDYGTVHLKLQDTEKGVLYKMSDTAKEAVVINETEREIMIMDPDNYETVENIKPPGLEHNGKVRVAKIEGELYLYPSSCIGGSR